MALKNVSAKLKVGGPATNGPAVWVPEFVEFCENNSVPYDFVSSHLYAGSRTGEIADVSVVVDGVNQAQKTIKGQHPWLVTEWSADAVANDWHYQPQAQYHELPASAAFVIACVDAVLANTSAAAHLRPFVLSYWVFSDVFQEGGFPTVNSSFHGGFGLINIYGVPKPAFRAFELMANLTGRRLPLAAEDASSTGGACAEQVRVLGTWDDARGRLQLLVANHAPQLGNSTASSSCNVTVRVETDRRGCTAVANASVRRIDDEHANPRQKWIDLGMPQYPSRAQNAEIAAASEAPPLPRFGEGEGVELSNGSVVARVRVPAYSVAALDVSLRCKSQ